jgi:hypothetical protein
VPHARLHFTLVCIISYFGPSFGESSVHFDLKIKTSVSKIDTEVDCMFRNQVVPHREKSVAIVKTKQLIL